jgi:hypothetical protein
MMLPSSDALPDVDGSFVEPPGLVGYDIIAGYASVSLLTDWGTDEDGV